MNRRVVITGLGVVSSLGIGKDTFWKNLTGGKSGIGKVEMFDTSRFRRHYAGEIKDFDPCAYLPKERVQFLGRASQFAFVAAQLALKDANIPLSLLNNSEIPVLIGTTMTEANAVDVSSQKFVGGEKDTITGILMLNLFAVSIPRNLGYLLKTKGFNALVPNACAAGNYTIGYGLDLIRQGKAEIAITGGAEALSRIAFQGFQRLYAMAPDVCSPFDKERKGMILGEGAGILIMEELESAQKRGASIYAEVLGYGLSCDAHHMTIPKKEGVGKAIQRAIVNSNVNPEEIDYISAHGTGTLANDKAESAAIKEVFGKRKVAVSSIKSMLGHCMGAASAIEAISCCLALRDNVVPPTMNFSTPDPECDVDCVPNKARRMRLKKVLNNGFAFGGNNCCVVFTQLQ